MVFFCFEKRSAFFALLWCVGFLFLRLHAAEQVGFLDQPTHSDAWGSPGSYNWFRILKDFSSEDRVVTMTYQPPHGPQTTVKVPSDYKISMNGELSEEALKTAASLYDVVRLYFFYGVCEENGTVVYKPFSCNSLDFLFGRVMLTFLLKQRDVRDKSVYKETILDEGHMRKWRACTPGTPLEANHMRIVFGAVALDGERVPAEEFSLPQGSLFPGWCKHVYNEDCDEGGSGA